MWQRLYWCIDQWPEIYIRQQKIKIPFLNKRREKELNLLKPFENMTKFIKAIFLTIRKTWNNCSILYVTHNVIAYQYLITKPFVLKVIVPITKMSQNLFFLISKYIYVKIVNFSKVSKCKFLYGLWLQKLYLEKLSANQTIKTLKMPLFYDPNLPIYVTLNFLSFQNFQELKTHFLSFLMPSKLK